MKKKAAIVTINDYTNFGNRLQNYAVQYILESYNLDVETLRINRIIPKSKNLKKLLKTPLNDLIFKLNNKFKCLLFKKRIKEREIEIKKFSNGFIKESKKIYSDEFNSDSILKDYDYFFVGSDQVWNPNYTNLGNSFLLKNIDSRKKMSFSASIGLSKLENYYKNKLVNGLKDFNIITVRENHAKLLLNSFGIENVYVILDPTMLIDSIVWKNMFKPNFKLNDYILIYNLGALSRKNRKYIKLLSKKNNLKVINLMEQSSEFFISDPIDFIQLIDNAKLVITDSFHATVFSIIMNTPFITTDRITSSSISSRIENILKKFEFDNRVIENINIMDVFKCDFTHTKEILRRERKKANEIINKFLNSES